MTKIEKAVRDFHDRVSNVERVIDSMNSVFMTSPESEFNSAIWAIVGAYKDSLDDAYCIGGWLEWWWLECNLGIRPMKASLAGEEMRTISSIDDLVSLILDDIKKSESEAK